MVKTTLSRPRSQEPNRRARCCRFLAPAPAFVSALAPALLLPFLAFALVLSASLSPASAQDGRVPECMVDSGEDFPGPWLIHFETGKAVISADDKKTLRRIADFAKAKYIRKICLIGRADKRGNPQYNRKLSLQRANAVRRYLSQLGVKRNTMHTFAIGEALNDSWLSDWFSEEDRRVEVIFVE